MSEAIEREDGASRADCGDSRRILAASLAAVLIHVVLVAIPLLSIMQTQLPQAGPLVVDLEASSIVTEEPSGAAAAQPLTVASAPAAPAASASSASDFAIPTPKAQSEGEAAGTTRGPSFREEGNRTGSSAQSPSAAAPPGPKPDFSTQAPAGGAPSAPPAKGQGVLVQGQGASPGGSLDLAPLDKALAGAKPAPGAGQPAGRPASPGERTGETGIRWDQPDAARSRKLLTSPEPKVPAWVYAQGLTLTVTVSFVVSPEGVIKTVTREKSCGYADVDAAVVDAVRHYRFSADSSALPIRGARSFIIRSR